MVRSMSWASSAVSFAGPGSLAGTPSRWRLRKRRSHCTKSSKFDGVTETMSGSKRFTASRPELVAARDERAAGAVGSRARSTVGGQRLHELDALGDPRLGFGSL